MNPTNERLSQSFKKSEYPKRMKKDNFKRHFKDYNKILIPA